MQFFTCFVIFLGIYLIKYCKKVRVTALISKHIIKYNLITQFLNIFCFDWASSQYRSPLSSGHFYTVTCTLLYTLNSPLFVIIPNSAGLLNLI